MDVGTLRAGRTKRSEKVGTAALEYRCRVEKGGHLPDLGLYG